MSFHLSSGINQGHFPEYSISTTQQPLLEAYYVRFRGLDTSTQAYCYGRTPSGAWKALSPHYRFTWQKLLQ